MRYICGCCTLRRKQSSDHIRADNEQEVFNVERLILFKYRSKPLQIHWVHDTPVVQPKDQHRGIVEKKLAIVILIDIVLNNGAIGILESRIICSIFELKIEYHFQNKQKSSYAATRHFDPEYTPRNRSPGLQKSNRRSK
jgi:hypothetical protein